MPNHSHIVHGCFCATTAELSSSNRDHCRIRAHSLLLGFRWFYQFTLPPAPYLESSIAYSLKITKASSLSHSPYTQPLDVSPIPMASTNASDADGTPTSKSATPTSLQLAEAHTSISNHWLVISTWEFPWTSNPASVPSITTNKGFLKQ